MDNKLLFTNRDLRRLLVPLIIEQIFAVTVGMADSIMVSSVSEAAMSAVSLVDSLIILIIGVFSALATGGAVVVGQYLGQKNTEKANKSGEQLVILVTLISIVVMVVMYLCKGLFLNVVFGSIEDDVKRFAGTYIDIVFLSIPFIALYNSGAALFRVMNRSKVTLVTSTIMNIINVSGNAILVYGLKMEIEGVAFPTLVSRAVAALLIIVLLFNEKLIVHLNKTIRLKLDRYMVRHILHLGVPNSIENSMFQLGKILLLSIIASFGTASISANTVGNVISSIEILPGAALGLGLVTVVSHCVGAKDYEQVKLYTKKLLKYSYLSMIFINVAVIVLLPLILNLFNLSKESREISTEIIIFHSICCCILWPAAFTLPNTLRAANDVRFAMIVSVTSMWVVRIGFSIVLAKVLNMGVMGVWVAMILDWVIRCIFFIKRYLGTKWQRLKYVDSRG